MLHYIPQHVSSSTLLIFKRKNCTITDSGIVTLCKQPYSMPVESRLHTRIYMHKNNFVLKIKGGSCKYDYYPYNTNQKMHYFLLIYFNNNPLHVSSGRTAHHQDDQLCINSIWYGHALCWLAAGRVGMANITYDCTNCCLYRVDPPHDERQACSKHVEAYYWSKLIENSASCWFILYGYITMHGQQSFKYDYYRRFSSYQLNTQKLYSITIYIVIE